MKMLHVMLVLASLAATNVFADWDAAGEAREEAQRKAAAAADARKKAEGDRMLRDAQAKSMRQHLGAAANGKSDAEVKRLYDQQMAEYQRAAKGEAGARARVGGLDANQRSQADSGLKSTTGKSLKDIEGMNEAQLEALGREMERKYGTK